MKRQTLLIPFVLIAVSVLATAVLTSSPPVVTAQGPAIVTVTPTPQGGVPAPAATEPVDPAAPPPAETAPVQVAPETGEPAAPAEPVAPVEVAPVAGDPAAVLDAVASDLTLLADQFFGTGARPEGWTPFLTPDNPQYALLLRLNLEILAGQIAGAEARPEGWFGAVGSSPFAIARDIRHDLELLASVYNDPPPSRPEGWRGDDPIMQCGRAVQALVGVLEAGGVFRLEADPTSPDYCLQAEIQASQFAEQTLLSNAAPAANPAAAPATGTDSVTTEFAVAFLDRGASLRVGVIPNGTPLTPVARSYAQFSNMMLASGDGFEVFVDYQQTSVSPEQFEALPNVDTLAVDPFCGADWCAGG